MIAPYEIAHPITLARRVRMTWPRYAVARCDVPGALVSGRVQGWRERLNRAVWASKSWEQMETIERRFQRMLENRRMKCEVFFENNR